MTVTACASFLGHHAAAAHPISKDARRQLIRHAQVWLRTDVPSMDLMAGPQEKGAFPPNATVTCDYVEKKLTGASPKFDCAISPEDTVKIKFDLEHGETQGEVAATRLFWALGFGADRMYMVKVVCRGCPEKYGEKTGDGIVIEPAAIERKMTGRELATYDDEGWSWPELDEVDPSAGGATVAQRDALKLLATFVQHTDNKASNQRLICLDKESKSAGGPVPPLELCEQPFMLVQDLGLTFANANRLNIHDLSTVNLARWSKTPVWHQDTGCEAEMQKSFSGSLAYPKISEEGRKFLGDLLMQLSDQQIHDLFAAARFDLNPHKGEASLDDMSSIDDWVAAFKRKREEIVTRHCDQ